MSSNIHIAGVVPVAGKDLNFNFDWHDSLMPLAPDYLALERSVIECAYAGCDTIWIICNDDVTPLVRHRIGEMLEDPVWANRNSKIASQYKRKIPIFYVPIHSKDRNRRDCLSWSVLYGALTCFKISSSLSKWVVPKKYYISFPYGVYDPSLVRAHRRDILGDKNFFFCYKNQSVREGIYTSFTLNKDDFIQYRRVIRKEGTGLYINPEPGELPSERLPLAERYSARNFTLDKVFKCAKLDISNVVELPWYHSIDSWNKYCEFLSSGQRMEKPNGILLPNKKWKLIGGG